MQRFRRKSELVEAEQWFPGVRIEGVHVDGEGCDARGCIHCLWRMRGGYVEGHLEVTPGDWVVKDVEGRLFAMEQERFWERYEPMVGLVVSKDTHSQDTATPSIQVQG